MYYFGALLGDRMGHIRAAAYGAGVAIAVFVYLGLPMLRRLYGPEATLAAYAGIALIAGGITYSLAMRLTAWLHREQDPTQAEGSSMNSQSDGNGQRNAAAVKKELDHETAKQELEQLQEDE
jgi:hypothetical protein